MAHMKRAMLGLLLVVGCSFDGPVGYDERLVDTFGQASGDQVTALTMMMDAYGAQPGWPLPAIEWIRGDKLNCDGVDAFGVARKGFDAPEGCLYGATFRALGLVQLADDGRPWSGLSFAHEMCHFVLDDQDHAGPCDPRGDVMSSANAALIAAGL